MPTYDFICKKCGSIFEEYLSFNDDRSKLKCPKCRSKKIDRNFGSVQMGVSKGAGSKAEDCDTCSTHTCSTT